jgi:antitoxin component of MazEF toxin-antitoxin module
MFRKIFRTGNSIVISLPRQALEYLGNQEGAEVSVELDHDLLQIVIAPIDVGLAIAGVVEEFPHQVKEFIEQYRPALEALAK